MNREDLNKLLKAKPLTFTYAEIEQMMDEEMAKDPEEMDTEFVDLCVEVLSKAISEEAEKDTEQKTKRTKIKLIKIIAIAAVIVVILGMAVTASAKYVYNDTSNKIVKFCEDHFSINLRNANTNEDMQLNNSADLITKLEESGFENVMLPTALLTDEYTYSVEIIENNEFTSAYLHFQNKSDDSLIYATITKHKNDINKFLDTELQMTSKYDSAKQLSLNGIDVFVFGNKNTSTITYIINSIDYDIELTDYSFDSTIEIAESIK
ncbi:MAG: hypothetical protein HDT34_04955 [Clostridiales bacterium]|nr:hypothetical protein [Clostridiales bacterium]